MPEPSTDPATPAYKSHPHPDHLPEGENARRNASDDETYDRLTMSPNAMSDVDVESSGSPVQQSNMTDRKGKDAGNSPNARSASISVADGEDTQGLCNRHPAPASMAGAPIRVGVSEDKNKKCRRTMEDAHAFIYDFDGVRGQGYFAIFDGHAGKHAAEWCGQHFHEYLLDQLHSKPELPIPDLLNSTFHHADTELSKLAAEDGTHSGCTAVTCFLRLEDMDGKPISASAANSPAISPRSSVPSVAPSETEEEKRRFGDGVHRERIRGFLSSSRSSSGTSLNKKGVETPPDSIPHGTATGSKRTLYTANVGDARAVLCRGGKAVRLTYDHKGSDAQEAKRITDAGGFVMNNRVNGVLAVTRSLGDSAMKEFVVGSPYTTETTLGPDDDYLIIACDGLWDVCEDQEAVDAITKAKLSDPQQASRVLLDLALSRFSSDNLSVMIVALKQG